MADIGSALAFSGSPKDYAGIYERGKIYQAKKKEKDASDFAKLDEFDSSKIKDLYPALGTKLLAAHQQYVNDVNTAYQKGGINAARREANMKSPALANIQSEIQMKNERAKKDEDLVKQGYYKTGADSFYKTLYDKQGKVEELDFSIPAYKLPDEAKMFDDFSKLYDEKGITVIEKPLPNSNGKVIPVYTTTPPKEVEDMATNQLLSNPGYNLKQRDLYGQDYVKMGYDINNADPIIASSEMHRAIAENVVRKGLTRTTHGAPTSPVRDVVQKESAEEKAAAKSAPHVSGNTATIGNAKWTYFSDGNQEIFTPSRTDVSENKLFDFERQKGSVKEQITGRLKNIVIGKDNKPEIHVIVSKDFETTEGKIVKQDVEEIVPYNPNNIGKIKNEFNANPYEIRKMFTGGSNIVPTSTTTGTTAKGTTSNVSKGTNSKPQDFTKLDLASKQELQKQSGAKTRGEFEQWLKDNNYTF